MGHDFHDNEEADNDNKFRQKKRIGDKQKNIKTKKQKLKIITNVANSEKALCVIQMESNICWFSWLKLFTSWFWMGQDAPSAIQQIYTGTHTYMRTEKKPENHCVASQAIQSPGTSFSLAHFRHSWATEKKLFQTVAIVVRFACSLIW